MNCRENLSEYLTSWHVDILKLPKENSIIQNRNSCTYQLMLIHVHITVRAVSFCWSDSSYPWFLPPYVVLGLLFIHMPCRTLEFLFDVKSIRYGVVVLVESLKEYTGKWIPKTSYN